MPDVTPSETGAVAPGDDFVLPFLLEVPDIRGRQVRVGAVVHRIIERHDYPEPVARLLAEMLALTGLLASTLKYDGVFTLQTKADGPVPLMVCDVTSDGVLRGYAKVDEDKLQALSEVEESDSLAAGALLGKGLLAFTVDQGPETDRYQGIVELTGPSLADSVQHYFRQSEQIKAGIKLGAARIAGTWRAGGLLLQGLPEDSKKDGQLGNAEEDDWRRSQVLMSSCTEAELLDPGLPSADLLYRLFHEERVRVYRERPLQVGCRCSRESVAAMLGSLPRDEVMALREDDDEVVVTCQFCNSDYRFDEQAVTEIFAA